GNNRGSASSASLTVTGREVIVSPGAGFFGCSSGLASAPFGAAWRRGGGLGCGGAVGSSASTGTARRMSASTMVVCHITEYIVLLMYAVYHLMDQVSEPDVTDEGVGLPAMLLRIQPPARSWPGKARSIGSFVPSSFATERARQSAR